MNPPIADLRKRRRLMITEANADVRPTNLAGERTTASETRPVVHQRTAVAPCLSMVPPRFRILEKLGQGGMGIVHRAIDCERGCEVAIKSLNAPCPDDLYRLKREFRFLSEVRHPNIVRLYELFVEDCKGFFTMDLVIGSNLHEFAHPTGTCDWTWFRSTARQLGSALDAVHANGKLHRDVKPSNIIVTPAGRVVLLDFGLAAVISPKNAKTKGERVLLGTRGYISPEQTRGEALTRASDWFSFGVTLFEAATGRRPFDDPFNAFWTDRRVDGRTRISTFVPDAPPDLDELISGLLDPMARRRPDAAEVLRVLAGSPVPTKGVTCRVLREDPQEVEHPSEEGARLRQAMEQVEQGHSIQMRVHSGAPPDGGAFVHCFLQEKEALGALVLRGRCRTRETIAFNAFDEVVDNLSLVLEHMPYAELVSVLPAHVAALPRLFPVLGRLDAATDGTFTRGAENDSDILRRARCALKNLLGGLSKRRPLIVWIDDAHWADQASEDLLRELFEPPDVPPMLLLLGYPRERESYVRVHESLGDIHSQIRTCCGSS